MADHVNGPLVMSPFDHPHDRIQRIVKEMGVDLGLQRVQLAPSLLLLFGHDVVHQLVDLLDRSPEGPPQVLYLLRSPDINIRIEVSILDVPDRFVQFPKGAGHAS